MSKVTFLTNENETKLLQQIDEAKDCPKHYAGPTRWYIDGVNGDDSNDGTENSPWKTIDHFFEQSNTTSTDIRCNIVSPGRYTITKPVVNGVTISITATVGGVELYFDTGDPLTFYNCHLNFEGVSKDAPLIINSSSENWLTEGGSTFLTFVKCNIPYTQNGGYIFTKICEFYTVTLSGVYGRIHETNYTVTDPTAYCLYTRESVVTLSGTTTFASRDTAGTGNSSFYTAVTSVIYLLHMANEVENQPVYGLNMDYAQLIGTDPRINSFESRSLEGNHIIHTTVEKDYTDLSALKSEVSTKPDYYIINSNTDFNTVPTDRPSLIYLPQRLAISNTTIPNGYYFGTPVIGSGPDHFRLTPTTLTADSTQYLVATGGTTVYTPGTFGDDPDFYQPIRDLNFEIGTFGGKNELAWWQSDTQYTISGTYQKCGDYVTITARARKIPGWIEIAYNLPFTPVNRSGALVCNGDDVEEGYTGTNTSGDEVVYIISTGTNTSKSGYSAPTVHIKRQDGKSFDSGTVAFTLTYKYKGDAV
jgi:hypothetical protein